jgi:hypothetical protein
MTRDLYGGAIGEFVAGPVALRTAALPDGLSLPVAGALGMAGAAVRASLDGAGVGPGRHDLRLRRDRSRRLAGGAVDGWPRAAHAVDVTGDLSPAVREPRPDGVEVALQLADDAEQLRARQVDERSSPAVDAQLIDTSPRRNGRSETSARRSPCWKQA